MRSRVGLVATPTGEGVTYSPNSPSISATIPPKGAINWVLSNEALVTSTWAFAALQAANPDSALVTAASFASSEAKPLKIIHWFYRHLVVL